MIALRYFSPAHELRPYVSSYYVFESDAPLTRDLLRAELAQVRFQTAGIGTFHYADGRSERCPLAMLTGATSTPILFESTGPMQIVGAGLLPAGWGALLGVDAAELADTTIDFGDLAGGWGAHTLQTLLGAPDDACRVRALDRLFTALLARERAVAQWFTRAADTWLMASANPSVDALVAATGVSVRQVERLARRYYGAPPKLLARKYRALQAAVRLCIRPGLDWSDAADGFYDQPHFIREFKYFVGQTPDRFQREMAPVIRLTIEKKQQLATMPRLALFS